MVLFLVMVEKLEMVMEIDWLIIDIILDKIKICNFFEKFFGINVIVLSVYND